MFITSCTSFKRCCMEENSLPLCSSSAIGSLGSDLWKTYFVSLSAIRQWGCTLWFVTTGECDKIACVICSRMFAGTIDSCRVRKLFLLTSCVLSTLMLAKASFNLVIVDLICWKSIGVNIFDTSSCRFFNVLVRNFIMVRRSKMSFSIAFSSSNSSCFSPSNFRSNFSLRSQISSCCSCTIRAMMAFCSLSIMMLLLSRFTWSSYCEIASSISRFIPSMSLSDMRLRVLSSGTRAICLSFWSEDVSPFVRPFLPSSIGMNWWVLSSLVWYTIARSALLSAILALMGLFKSMIDWSKMEASIAASMPPGNSPLCTCSSALRTLIVGRVHFWKNDAGI